MGDSNIWLLPAYKKHLIKDLKINEKPNMKIAWLGQQNYGHPEVWATEKRNVDMFECLAPLFSNCQHDLYDIANENSWDVHNSWDDIKGYDLVLALRITYLVKSSSHLLKEMKKAVENNGAFYTDFCSGNIRSRQSAQSNLSSGVVSWRSDNLVCFLPEYWPKKMLAYGRVRDLANLKPEAEPDNLLTKEMLNDHSLGLKDYKCFKDSHKKRLQLLTKVVKI